MAANISFIIVAKTLIVFKYLTVNGNIVDEGDSK